MTRGTITMLAAGLVTFSTACDRTPGTLTGALVGTSSTLVAQQALGSGARSIEPTEGHVLSAPGIYRFHDDGWIEELCSRDMRMQNALTAIEATTRESEDTIADRPSFSNVNLTVSGFIIRRPYISHQIEGYTVTNAQSPTGEGVADYIIRNVADTCRNEVLPKTPFYVVIEEARAKKATTRARGALAGEGSVAGLIGWEIDDEDVISSPRTNVTFGVRAIHTGVSSTR